MASPIKNGSFSPNKTILNEQLSHENNDSIESKVSESTMGIWSDGKRDLSRLSKIVLNGKTVVDFKAKEPLSASADEIFDEILMRTADSKVANKVVSLFEQGLILGVQTEIQVKTGMINIEKAESTHALTTKDKIYVLDTDAKTFKVVEEVLYQKIPMNFNSDEPPTYFKMKIIVSGTKADLREGNTEKLTFKALHSQEYKTIEEAKKVNYAYFKKDTYLS